MSRINWNKLRIIKRRHNYHQKTLYTMSFCGFCSVILGHQFKTKEASDNMYNNKYSLARGMRIGKATLETPRILLKLM